MALGLGTTVIGGSSGPTIGALVKGTFNTGTTRTASLTNMTAGRQYILTVVHQYGNSHMTSVSASGGTMTLLGGDTDSFADVLIYVLTSTSTSVTLTASGANPYDGINWYHVSVS